MKAWLGIAVAGAIGALVRYGLGITVTRRWPVAFPWATLAINVSGAFVLGVVFAFVADKASVSTELKATVMIGFLGAYTTFSTLSLETFKLIEDGSYGLAAVNSLGSLVAGLLAVWVGITVGNAL